MSENATREGYEYFQVVAAKDTAQRDFISRSSLGSLTRDTRDRAYSTNINILLLTNTPMDLVWDLLVRNVTSYPAKSIGLCIKAARCLPNAVTLLLNKAPTETRTNPLVWLRWRTRLFQPWKISAAAALKVSYLHLSMMHDGCSHVSRSQYRFAVCGWGHAI